MLVMSFGTTSCEQELVCYVSDVVLVPLRFVGDVILLLSNYVEPICYLQCVRSSYFELQTIFVVMFIYF